MTTFDAAEYLDSEGVITEYLVAIKEQNNPILLKAALEHVARARILIAKVTQKTKFPHDNPEEK